MIPSEKLRNRRDMKHKILYVALLSVLASCNSSDKVEHRGEIKPTMKVVELDSLVVPIDSLSGNGNFFLLDSCIYFADTQVGSIFGFSLKDGHLVSKDLKKGNGHNELPNFMYFYPFRNKPDLWWAVDASYFFYTYDRKGKVLTPHGRIDFEWNNMGTVDFESPSYYGIMEMTDYGIDFTYINDSLYIIPLKVMYRYIGDRSADAFTDGRIFGELNPRNMKVERVYGRMPEIYHERPNPILDYFHYDFKGDTLYVSHCVDSLIYVYKYPDKLLFTMGYEEEGFVRDYTVTDKLGYNYRKDMETVGKHTSMKYVPETGLLLRTSLISGFTYEKGITVLQAYKGEDLVLETSMPDYFQYLGYYNGKYYGVRHITLENDERMYFVFYCFDIINK